MSAGAAVLLAGCAQVIEKPVTVYYDTTRKSAPHSSKPETYFSGDGTQNRKERFGAALVSLKHHTPPSDRDAQIVSFDSFGSPADFLNALRAGSKGDQKPAIIYVHGFNNSFADAAHRAAFFEEQLRSYVLPIPIIYSWPSRRHLLPNPLSYSRDEDSYRLDVNPLSGFLGTLRDNLPKAGQDTTANVLVVGHSLGCRFLTDVLHDMYDYHIYHPEELKKGPIFKHLVLLEPDVSSDYFAQHLIELRCLFEDITVYISPRDIALYASYVFHSFKRINVNTFDVILDPITMNIENEVVPLARVDVINASALNSDIVGHSYDDPQLFKDLKGLIKHQAAKDRNTLAPQPVKSKDPATGNDIVIPFYQLRR